MNKSTRHLEETKIAIVPMRRCPNLVITYHRTVRLNQLEPQTAQQLQSPQKRCLSFLFQLEQRFAEFM